MAERMNKAKPPREVVEFLIQLYALKQYRRWTDEDLAKRLGATTRLITKMRADPFSVSGQYILKVQALYEKAKAEY